MDNAEPQAVCFAGLRLDPAARTLVDSDGREITLRRAEFELLLAFVRAPGRVLTRDHLLQIVSGRRSEPYDRSIDVLVSQVRRKIEPEPSQPRLIITVSGVGYRFAAKPAPSAGAPEAESAMAPAPPPSAPAQRPERRQLTIVHCALGGPAWDAARGDPEDLHRLLAALHARCAAIVTPLGGMVANLARDGVVSYFGYPHALEDAAERAIRASLSMVGSLAERPGEDAGEAVRARIGIATGVLIVGKLLGNASQQLAAIGPAASQAGALAAVAPLGAVLIADSTRRLVGELFRYRTHAPVAAEVGSEPEATWRVIDEVRAQGRFEALRGRNAAELVGREEELGLLLRRWEQAKSGTGKAVLITGEPGIGKSRLVIELANRAAELRSTLRYFCGPNRSDSALFPVIGQLEHASRIKDDDRAETKTEKLETLLALSEASDEEIALIAGLLAIPASGGYVLPDMSPQRRRQKTFEVLLAQLDRLAGQFPVRLIYEDVHWIDPSSLEVLSLTLERLSAFRSCCW